MEKIKNTLKYSTKIIVISIIIVILIILSFVMVRFVPKMLSSMANATVSLTSSFTPTNSTTTTTTVASSTDTGILEKIFGPRKDSSSDVSFSVSTTTKKNVKYYNDNTSYGTPDLAVQITSVGVNRGGTFIQTNNFTSTDTVIIKFKIENQGTSATGPWTMKVTMPSSNTNDQVRMISANSIPSGQAITGQAVFNTPNIGNNQIATILVDSNNIVNESNENNNQASININVNSNYYNNNYNNNYYNNIPDLSIRLVSVGKIDQYNQYIQTDYLRTNEKVAIKFEVTNNSSVYTSSWSWKSQLVGPNQYNYYNNNYNTNGYTYNNDGSRTYTNPYPESGLAPGETKTFTTTFDGLSYGSNYVTIFIDSTNTVNESSEGNNILSKTFFVNY